MTRSNIRQTVMRRVYFVHAVRPFLTRAAGAVALLAISLYFIGREVFVVQVFRNLENVPADALAFARFFEAAFTNTTYLVQLLTVLAAVALLWLLRECVRLILRTSLSVNLQEI